MSFSDPGGTGIEGAGHHLQIDRRQGCREPGGPRRLFSAYCARICTQVLQSGSLLGTHPVPVPVTPGVTRTARARGLGRRPILKRSMVDTVQPNCVVHYVHEPLHTEYTYLQQQPRIDGNNLHMPPCGRHLVAQILSRINSCGLCSIGSRSGVTAVAKRRQLELYFVSDES